MGALRRKALLGFQRGAHHQQRHHRANMFDGDFTAKAVAAGFAVPYFVFVIIVRSNRCPSPVAGWSRLPATVPRFADW